MNLNERALAKAKLVGGRLCLDFANTLGGRIRAGASGAYEIREERLNDYFDLLAWGVRAGLLSEYEAQVLSSEAQGRRNDAESVWKRAIALREAVYRITRGAIAGMSRKSGGSVRVIRRRAAEQEADTGVSSGSWDTESQSSDLTTVFRIC